MSWINRLANVFRRGRIEREIEEELAAHVEEAVEMGRSAEEARRALGPELRYREQSRDIKLLPWLDSLASDAVFGWRQLKRRRVASAAAILSLALAIGATTAAFRLVDAVLLRKLPVAQPERLYYLALTQFQDDRDGRPDYFDFFDYPTFRAYREVVGNQADLMVAGNSYPQDATFGGDAEPRNLMQQYYSGNVFGVFGLQPALGRLLTPNDDKVPGGHPVAVISYDYWRRHFARDPQVLGKRFVMSGAQFEIVGVAPKGFTGTEPGAPADVFVPATMHTEALEMPGWTWFRMWVRPKDGVGLEQIRQMLQGYLSRYNQERVKEFAPGTPKPEIESVLQQSVLLFPAGQGASNAQRQYRRPLWILSALVVLVLLLASANIANLMTAQAASRAREMALRVSIGAGRARLVQLMLVESALVAAAASLFGALFSWWSAPFVVSMLTQPEDPVQLDLAADWRAIAFGAALTIAVTLLFGLAPALRASRVNPASALKGGEDPHARGRLMRSLVAVQMAFCVMVLFIAGLFVKTFEQLATRPLGFTHQHVWLVGAAVPSQKLTPEAWMQVVDRVRQTPGVQSAAFAAWALMTGNRWGGNVRVPGRDFDPRVVSFLEVSGGFFETMQIGWMGGRDFRTGEGKVGIVNEAFARQFFDGQNPIGRTAQPIRGQPFQIIGWVRDAAYGSVREEMRPVVYFPLGHREDGRLIVRAADNVAPVLRRELPQVHAGLRLGDIERQSALVERQMIRERLLAALSLFFAIVALALAATGVYGVLNYSVTQQRREIGIRMALGARARQIVRCVAGGMLAVVLLGAAAGLVAGVASGRFVEMLLYEVKATDVGMLATPFLMLLGVGVLAALPPAMRAVSIDPAETLRTE